ncbi:hypothetical protein [Aureivirga marina]|uniref:hypothetical protein n=1 Tax=Aureivirga marina TaxID=1182451 RepID=UPI0018C9D347|nr:hypothetical protein [Aureivirga marina]
MWYEKLIGCEEVSSTYVRKNIEIKGNKLISKVNGKSYQFGKLEVPTLKELKEYSFSKTSLKGKIKIGELIGNVQEYHMDSENKNAVFQAASQFNLLEMVGPDVTPEKGVSIYAFDHTQGPACAIACGAGTIYRNYFAEVNNKIGQTYDNQIDCLDLIGEELGNSENQFWEMKNGYVITTEEKLQQINQKLKDLNQTEREELKDKLKVGIQWNTEVTIANSEQIVSQVYCSALPVAYSFLSEETWELFARIVLEATYEATFYAALQNFEKTGCNKLFLTLVGGGAFGNKMEWIMESIEKVLKKFENTSLEVNFISYGKSKVEVQNLIYKFSYK